ncbi:hypothetical protein ANCDUO_20534, partial [Ancylostoma duodenale]
MDDDMSVVENMRKSLDELNIQIAELEEEFLKLDEGTSQKQNEIRQITEDLKEVKADFAEAKKRVTELENEEEDVREKIRGVDAAVDADRKRQERLRESLVKMDATNKELEEEKAVAEERAKRSEELPTPPSMTNPPDMDQLGDTAELDEQYKTLTMKIESAEKMQVLHGFYETFRMHTDSERKISDYVPCHYNAIEDDISKAYGYK